MEDITLKTWLKKPCGNNQCIFEDPGYSGGYKSFFNFEDTERLLYPTDSDIDIVTNATYFAGDENSRDHLEDYVDAVPAEGYPHGYRYIIIPPGSNQSNANYFFKILNYHGGSYYYKTPVQGEGGNKNTWCNMEIDKNLCYQFIYENSL